MNTPEFTAEASSYKSSKSYIEGVHTYSGDRSQIVPASIPWIFPWIVTSETAKDCDQTALQVAANAVCANAALKTIPNDGWICTAKCTASNFGHDSDCNPTGGHCSCELTCTR